MKLWMGKCEIVKKIEMIKKNYCVYVMLKKSYAYWNIY